MAKWPVILAGTTVTAGLLASMQPDVVVKPSTTSRTTSTILDDPDLSLPVEANATYRISFELAAGGVIAAGISMRWAVPSGATGGRYILGPGTAANDGAANNIAVRLGGHEFTTLIGYAGVRNSVSAFSIIERATVFVGATAGFVTLQWGQTTTNATGTLIAVGSIARAERVG